MSTFSPTPASESKILPAGDNHGYNRFYGSGYPKLEVCRLCEYMYKNIKKAEALVVAAMQGKSTKHNKNDCYSSPSSILVVVLWSSELCLRLASSTTLLA